MIIKEDMEKKMIRLKMDMEGAFRYYIGIMNPFLKLSNREAETLSQLLNLNYQYKSYSDPVKWKLVFDKENRKKIYTDMGISVHQFNNILTALRKKNIILEGNILTKKLLVYPDNGLNINFQIEVNERTREVHKEVVN
jgi:hypothetical protein